VIMIIISCLLKLFALFLLNSFNIVILGIIALFYLIVIYIHLMHTGYYLAERSVQKAFKNQYNRFCSDRLNQAPINQDNIATLSVHPFSSPLKLGDYFSKCFDENNPDDLRFNQTIVRICENGNADPFLYQIRWKGVLTDDDINTLTNGLGQTEMTVVGLHCRILQLRNTTIAR